MESKSAPSLSLQFSHLQNGNNIAQQNSSCSPSGRILCLPVGHPLGFASEAALEDLGLPQGGPGVEVVQLLGLQGFWHITCAGPPVSNPYANNELSTAVAPPGLRLLL